MQYQIIGKPFPVVVCNLTDSETMINQSGSMAWCTANMAMDTTTKGGFGKVIGRFFSGESLFLNRYTAHGEGLIAYASSFPGEIVPFEITSGKDLIVQKGGFLAGTENVELSVFLQKKLSSGFFGGEGFVLQKLSGNGTAFVEIDGYCHEYELKEGQQVVLNSGYLAAMDATCSIDIKSVGGIKNMVFGGQGIFNTIITGPGHVYIQTKPISVLAKTLEPFLPKPSNTTINTSD